MKRIETFENAITNQCKDLIKVGIEPTVFWAYRNAMRNGNERIDFSDVIWDEDIQAITDSLAENGITEFTISSTFSGLIKTLVEFEKRGFKMVCTTEVKATYKDWLTDDFAKVPALLMQRV